MKQTIILLIITVFFSCKKNPEVSEPPVEPVWGADSFAATINGMEWIADTIKIRKNYNDSTTISVEPLKAKINANGRLFEADLFYVRGFKKDMSRQKLNRNTNPLFQFFARDRSTNGAREQSSSVFRIDTSDVTNNWIQITEQKNGYQQVRGIFSAVVIKNDTTKLNDYTDTLIIRNGYFRVTIRD